jgi:hypothetical protein
MSALRPTLTTGSIKPCMTDGTALLLIYKAVQDAPGLIHGKLSDGHGEHCAIGNYFERHNNTSLPESLIDEVAAVNDSVPNVSHRQRKLHVAKWLRWKLAQLGMPEFVAAVKRSAPRRK